LTRFSTIPKGRVILDGTGNAQNVPDVGGDSRLDGCLLAVHDYSFFGSESMTSESQWADHLKGSVGSYADRTLCTEWGGPMSPGSKNGKSYDYLDYSKSPSNYFEAYIRGISSQLRSWNMGSFYWPGLRDGDWYSMTIKNGSGANITLSIPNQSGLDRLHYAWTGPAPNADAGAGGTSGRDGAAAGDAGGAGGDSGPATGGAGGGGGTGSGTGGAGGGGGTGSGTGGAGGMGGTVASGGVGGGSSTASGGTPDSGVPSGSGGKAATGGSIASGGRLGAGGSMAAGGSASGGSGAGGAGGASTRTNPDVASSAGCSCGIGAASGKADWPLGLLLGALVGLMVRRRLRVRPVGLNRR
jgi:hypothetical protein